MANAKKYVDATRRYDRDNLHAPSEAIDLVKTLASAKFDESVDLVIRLGVDPRKALVVVIAVLIYQQIENYVLQPRVTAQTLDMHPAVAFAAVLAGTATFGVTGALLALPFLATVQSFISAYVARHTVVDSYLLSTEIPHVVRSRHHNDEQDHEDADRQERRTEDLSQGDG